MWQFLDHSATWWVPLPLACYWESSGYRASTSIQPTKKRCDMRPYNKTAITVRLELATRGSPTKTVPNTIVGERPRRPLLREALVLVLAALVALLVLATGVWFVCYWASEGDGLAIAMVILFTLFGLLVVAGVTTKLLPEQ
ncbi:MAG TPA: hypothetical protein VFZ58_03980 [Candidatus Saccharimonadales bacterium]